MTEQLAGLIVGVAGIYAAIGIVFAIPFVLRGAGRIDPNAVHGSRGFRVLIFPGSVALWPLLALRWLRSDGTPPEEHNTHRAAARRGVA